MTTTIIIDNITYVREIEVFLILFCFMIIFFIIGYLFGKKSQEMGENNAR